ncbi:MAG: bifunctional diaminohydroxyphosphoribosylaminopyrimidine deaminase/5-amino-6-(5-phosphoribosylamino)uracil reductase RibD [Pseudomonadota bacterium]
MARALKLASRGLYTCDPNPRVGCVFAKNEKIIGEGWHQKTGEAHAEINALSNATESVSGATAYVTLEPCSHHGSTPPCCEALLAVGVARVVVAMQDPNPLVCGNGIAFLKQNGIDVTSGLMADQAHTLNPGFVNRMRHSRPWVRAKIASSLDGKSALNSGESQWITGVDARNDGHRWRARSACILTGSGTVMADNPTLTARPADVAVDAIKQPVRAIVAGARVLPSDATVFNDDAETIVFAPEGSSAVENLKSTEVVSCTQRNAGKADLREVLATLAERGINELHVEAGATLTGALLEQRLVDEVLLYQAPSALGHAARGILDIHELKHLSQKIEFSVIGTRRVGQDMRWILRPTYG